MTINAVGQEKQRDNIIYKADTFFFQGLTALFAIQLSDFRATNHLPLPYVTILPLVKSEHQRWLWEVVGDQLPSYLNLVFAPCDCFMQSTTIMPEQQQKKKQQQQQHNNSLTVAVVLQLWK